MGVRNMTEPKQINKKLCIIGDGHTGKTCVLFRFKENKFIPSYEPTIFDNESKICEYRGQKVRLSLWDTAGQEEFESIRVLAYDDTDILLIAFCVTELAIIMSRINGSKRSSNTRRANFPMQR